jgi:3-deoxy-manno-octulosonate cytidylyltransferase (CMP-KDO synthetase)
LAAVVVIPARFASTRFPGKMLASETGRPLVQHVVDQVKKCRRINRIIVAADDERIVSALRPFGTECMLTDPSHPSGTDRVAEVAGRLGKDVSPIINVQGDEPEIEPAAIDGLDSFMKESGCEMCTLATPLPAAGAGDANLVKVAISQTHRAMYFSRLPIPFQRDAAGAKPTYYLHVGIYAYRRDTLIRLAGLKPTPCEQAEKLEQLRALENDIPIGVMLIDHATHGIDTAEQYQEFVRRFKNQGRN